MCEKESSIFFPRRAPEASVASRESAASREFRDLGFGCLARGDGEWADRPRLSLPPSPEHVRANLPVEFTQDYLFPSPRARDTVSFGIDDVLLTAASDSEDLRPSLADALPPSGQEARPSPGLFWALGLCFRTPLRSSRWIGPNEPRESRSSKLDERFLSGVNSKMSGGSCRFSVICIRRSPDPGNSLLSSRLTNAPAADFTNLVGSVEQGYTAMPSLAPSWKSCPLLPSKPCRTTSALIGKSYIAAGQAGMALHTMAILQAY